MEVLRRHLSRTIIRQNVVIVKELLIIPDAVHTDLYDKIDIIPFDKIESFFKKL